MINEIPEYQILLKEINEHKKLLNKQPRMIKSKKDKINRLDDRYKFIFDIFSPTVGDTELEDKVHLLMKNIGYKSVTHITEDKRNPDIVIDEDGFKTVIEVKNRSGQTIDENEILQLHKYKQRYQDDFKDLTIRGIFILNHDNQKPIGQRNKNPFDEHRERDAKLNGYSVMSTTELLKAFILIKKKELTLEEFDKIIHAYGTVKFSKRAIKKVLAGQA